MTRKGRDAWVAERRLNGHLSGVFLEGRSTDGTAITVRLTLLAKIAHDARGVGKMPALALNFVYGTGRPHPDGAWILMREIDFRALTGGDE